MEIVDPKSGMSTQVDDDVAQRLEGRTVRVHPNSQGLLYAYVDGEELHRYVLEPEPGFDVDHRNRDTLDNRLANLRQATRTQNLQNRRGWGSHGKGVIRKPARAGKGGERFEARITIDGRRVYLGRRSTAEEARELYAAAALEHFGEFACLEWEPKPR